MKTITDYSQTSPWDGSLRRPGLVTTGTMKPVLTFTQTPPIKCSRKRPRPLLGIMHLSVLSPRERRGGTPGICGAFDFFEEVLILVQIWSNLPTLETIKIVSNIRTSGRVFVNFTTL